MSISILIEGMEMPKDCIECRFCLFTGVYWKCLVDGSHADFGGTCRPSECPLVPVPPHRRLIDASEKIRVQMYDDEHEDFHTVEMTIDDLLSQSWVKAYAYPIIPASESKERPAFLPQYELTPRREEG